MRKLLTVLAILTLSSMAFAGTIVTMQYNGAVVILQWGSDLPLQRQRKQYARISDVHQLQRARHWGRNLASNRNDYPPVWPPEFPLTL